MPKSKAQPRYKVESPAKLRMTKSIVLRKKSPVFNGFISSYELIEKVLDTTPFHLATVDKNGYYTSWNKASENMFGYLKNEVIGKLKPSVLHRNDKEAGKVIETALKNSEFNGEVILVRKNGEHFPARLNVKLLKDNMGRTGGFLGSAIDLSKERLIEQERDVSEEKHRQLFENSKDAIIYIDTKGVIIDANEACKEISGYDLDVFTGKCFYFLPFLKREPKYALLITSFLQNDDIEPFELELTHKNGFKKVVEVNLSSAKKNGNVKYFQVIIRDITARKATEEALRHSKNVYRAIFENTGTATMIIEGNDIISFANTQFVNMSGYEKEDILNKMRWFDFFSKEDFEMMNKFRIKRMINPYSVPRNYETRFVTKDSEVRNVFLTVAMIPGTKKSVVSILDITARKIAENELKVSKKLFDDLVQGSPVAIYVINTEHKIVYWNKAMEDITGYQTEQMIGTSNHWKPFYNKPTRQIEDMIIDGAEWGDIVKIDRYKKIKVESSSIQKGIVISKLFDNFCGKGKRWIRFKIKPLYSINGELAGTIEIIEDITEYKEMERHLANRMREFHALYQINSNIRMVEPLNNVLSAIVKDLVLACDEVEPARARIKFDGKVFSTLKKGERFLRRICKNIDINGKKRGSIEIGYVHKTEHSNSFKLKHEGKIIYILADTLGRHIQSREILERYQKLVAKSISGIFILQNGVFQYVNPKFVRMFKLKNNNEILGMFYSTLLPGCLYSGRSNKDTKPVSSHCTIKTQRRDGVFIDVEVYTQIIDYYGKKAVLGTVQDVTRLREAHERQQNFNKELKKKIADRTKDLQIANRRLLSLNEMKDEFIAVASHELRSPLTSVRGYLSFLVENDMFSKIPEAAKDYLSRVYDNVEVLNNLVNNILDVSRIEMNRFELHRVPTDIFELARQVVKNFSFQANEKRLKINIHNKTDSEILMLNLDQVRIRQVLRNIIDNAIKYSPKGKEINVEIEKRGIGIQISVIDQGVGIKKSEIFDIFDKFKQAKNSHMHYAGGAGLGLFIAKRIMEMHNGMIWAESEKRRGSAFRMQLPIGDQSDRNFPQNLPYSYSDRHKSK